MLHQPEFCFLKTALEKLHLPVHCLTPDRTPEQPLDMGIRRFLGREEEYLHLFQTVPFQMAQNTIYKMSDAFLCNYLFLLLPGRTQQAVLIGPYLTVQLTREQLLQEAEHHAIPPALFHQLETFYGSVPVLTDEAFLLSRPDDPEGRPVTREELMEIIGEDPHIYRGEYGVPEEIPY